MSDLNAIAGDSEEGRCPEDLRTINKVTGLMFRFLRERADYSHEEVADRLEMHVDEVEGMESGDIPMSVARLYLAGKLFGVKASAFFAPYYYPDQFH